MLLLLGAALHEGLGGLAAHLQGRWLLFLLFLGDLRCVIRLLVQARLGGVGIELGEAFADVVAHLGLVDAEHQRVEDGRRQVVRVHL